jgi:hypothetical protein
MTIWAKRRKRFAIAIAALAAIGGALLWPISASADGSSTTTAFVDTTPVTVSFGADWLITIKVSVNDYPVNLDNTYGSVDVYLSGINGAYATGLPLQPGGLAYFAQPSAQAPLGAGTYAVTAIFQPSAGGGLKTSQTTTPASITVSQLNVNPSVKVTDDPAVAAVPTITATLAGSYVDKNGGAPSGLWSFTVNDSSGKSVFDSKVAQPAGEKKPLVIGIDSGIKQGTTYSVESTFTPSKSVAPGVTVAKIPTASFHSADGSFADKLAAPVAIPVWLFIVILAFAAVLIAATIFFARRIARAPKPAPKPRAQPKLLAEPDPDDLMTLEEAGFGATHAESPAVDSTPEPGAQAGRWMLGAETPTVKMDTAPAAPVAPTVSPNDVPPVVPPTERLDTTPTNNGASSD